MINTSYTLTTACFRTNNAHHITKTLESTIDATNQLMKIPVYLVIYGDSETMPFLKAKREQYGHMDKTVFIEINKMDMWSFQYIDKVKENREKYWPTRDLRTNEENHLITCNKCDLVLKTIESNPFNTTHFGWVDSFLGKDTVRICEEYDENANVLPNLLNQIADEKFHIQTLNVCDKKYLLSENKREFYSKYQWIVCGTFFAGGKSICERICLRLKDIFIQTTEMGYGHAEEMFYLEILDEFYDEIAHSYGDYGQIWNNMVLPMKNVHYIYWLILQPYMNYGYYVEACDCGDALLKAFLKHSNNNITEDTFKAFNIPKSIFINMMQDYHRAALKCKPEIADEILKYLSI